MNPRLVCGNQKGIVLPIALVFLVVLGVMGGAAVLMTGSDMKISGNYKNSETAFYVAEAGIENAREALRAINAVSGIKNAFSDELAGVTGSNGILDGYTTGTDDVPLLSGATLGNSSYTVYLTNDAGDGPLNLTDSNQTVTLTSVATGPIGSTATIESTVRTFDMFPPPGAITLLGNGASFSGNNSNAKELHGDDQCGTVSPKPVVAVSYSGDVPGIKASIDSSKPKTYYTKDEDGNDVTAFTDPDAVTAMIPASTISNIISTYGINLLDAYSLNNFVNDIKKLADTVAAGGTDANSVDVGSSGNSRVVVVTGDFDLNDDGAGILLVTGDLTFKGNIDFDGLILVFGKGSMVRNGAGNGTISGGIIVANTLGPDGIAGTADDVLGPPTFDTSGGGNSNVRFCSTVVDDMLSGIPPRPISFKHYF